MSWLERVTKPHQPSATTIVLYRDDSDEPLIFNLQGLRQGQALSGVLEAIVQEHYCEQLEPTAEFLWQHKGETWGEQVDLVFNVRRL